MNSSHTLVKMTLAHTVYNEFMLTPRQHNSTTDTIAHIYLRSGAGYEYFAVLSFLLSVDISLLTVGGTGGN